MCSSRPSDKALTVRKLSSYRFSSNVDKFEEERLEWRRSGGERKWSIEDTETCGSVGMLLVISVAVQRVLLR